MAEKQDIPMNQFQIVTDADYVYVEKENSQGKITAEDLMEQMGLFRKTFTIPAGGQFELPFDSGLITVQNYSQNHDKSVAILYANGRGNVIVSAGTISFFSDVEDKICVINTGDRTKYIIKNRTAKDRAVKVTFIQ